MKEILISCGKIEKVESISSIFVIPTPLKNEVGFKRIEPEASDMEIDNEPVAKKHGI